MHLPLHRVLSQLRAAAVSDRVCIPDQVNREAFTV